MVPVPLLVLGAQFSGLATALFLAHQGFPVHVLDREPRDAVGDDAVVLSPRAFAELAGLGLLPARGVSEPARLLHADACTGSPLRTAELGAAVRARYGRPYLLVARAALRALLVAACDADDMVTVEYDRTIATVEDLGDAALVTTDDGVLYRAEALVGADGPFSRVRQHLGGGHPMSAPYLLHRRFGAPPHDEILRLWSSPSLHVSHVAGPDGRGDVSVVARLDALDDMDHEAVDEVVTRLLEGSAPEVRAATEGAGPTVTRVMRHHAPLERWSRHRMTVVGCAAQPILPHTAQSSSLALLDAAALGRAFDRVDGRIVPALEEYARERIGPRTAAAARSLDFATLCHAEGLMRRLRDRLWRALPIDATADVVELSERASPETAGDGAIGHVAG